MVWVTSRPGHQKISLTFLPLVHIVVVLLTTDFNLYREQNEAESDLISKQCPLVEIQNHQNSILLQSLQLKFNYLFCAGNRCSYSLIQPQSLEIESIEHSVMAVV